MSDQIEKLPQDVVNKIAAGEVIERPASVVKELVDNSLDAGSSKIIIRIAKGGTDLIEVADNGIGMSCDNLQKAFIAHTTSKLTSLEDLDTLLTMGFRGEALSTIVSVADVEAVSKDVASNIGSKVIFNGIEPDQIEEHPTEVGTTISVKNLFKNIPARLKYLRAPETEYRHILKLLTPYFLSFPNVHFQLFKDGREIYNLPEIRSAKNGDLTDERIRKVLKSPFTEEMIPIFFDGSGIGISGFVASPKFHSKRTTVNYTFLNGRPINDRGVYRSVIEGFGSFIPHSEKIPFLINIQLSQTMVDINVHPRKEEVKFLNPYRIYSAVEQAVRDALSKEFSGTSIVTSSSKDDDNAYARLRSSTSSKSYNDFSTNFNGSDLKESRFSQTKGAVQSSINFSREMLQSSSNIAEDFELEGVEGEKNDIISVTQIFRKYILVELETHLWVVDQHAAAERITFERLKKSLGGTDPDVQNLLIQKEIILNEEERSYFSEKIDYFAKLGFGLTIESNTLSVSYVPVEFSESDIEAMMRDLITDDEQEEVSSDLDQKKDMIIATIACHNSIRSSQRLANDEALSLVQQLFECDNPYSCPHGRPVVWQLTLNEIDSHFDRTY